ncbi:MAG: hypothetical protein ACYTFY_04610 [Planctomycetota bacterium]|jgi:5-methyltetrahydrofolate--homocysteine methyltransferase
MIDEFVQNWEKTKQRFEAWWNNDMLDRPLFSLAGPREKPRWDLREIGETDMTNSERHWLDPEYVVDQIENNLASVNYYGDSFPQIHRGLNTTYLSSFAGAEPHFDKTTVTIWTEPFVDSWESAPEPAFDTSGEIFQKILKVSDALTENCRGRYVINMPDSTDAVTSMSMMRGVENLCYDMADNPESVYSYRDKLVAVWKESHTFWLERDKEKGLSGSSVWAGFFTDKRDAVLQCDFSYMISPEMFETLVKPELAEEGKACSRTLFHLDGPGEVPHLDILLEMPEITAIQWVPGAGNPASHEYTEPLLRTQAAGKPVQLSANVVNLDKIFEIYDPRGVFLRLGSDTPISEDDAADITKRIEKWGGKINRNG